MMATSCAYLKPIFLLSVCFHILMLPGQQLHHLSTAQLIDRQKITPLHAQKFAQLQVQDFQGRIKPIHTLALELLRKIHGKNNFSYSTSNGQNSTLNATQVFLGMQFRPDSWQLLPMIKIEKNARDSLSKIFEIDGRGYAKPAQLFDFSGKYRLKEMVTDAYAKAQGKRNVWDKTVLKIDERINIIWGIFNGQFLRIFPHPLAKNRKWYAPTDLDVPFVLEDKTFFLKIIPNYFHQLENALESKDWTLPNETLVMLDQFQKNNAGDLLRSETLVDWEIFYNERKIFFFCMIGYTLVGILLLFVSFMPLFFTYNWITIGSKITVVLTLFIFLYHGFGIGLRWYISGHAPWSNGYEATVFISWISVMAGLLFGRKTRFPIAATALIAVCLLGIAHGSLMSPEITNLVPVLQSYWLMIHVAIITGSYGFLTLGSLLALMTLLCMALINANNQKKIVAKALELTKINERTTTLGLYMLSIGTFLGGVWANESWGRYWGWDPKETWALISIVIYAFVLHIRIIFPKQNLVFYNCSSLFALASLVMTFFGVNYYLSGLHSYAKGDSFPIPIWIYIVIPLLVMICFIANYRWKALNQQTLDQP